MGDKRFAEGWWTIGETPAAVFVELDSTVKLSGTNAVHLRFDPRAGPYARVDAFAGYQLEPVLRAGSEYIFSCYVKTRDIELARIDLYEYPAPFPKGTIHRSKALQGTHDWTRLSITFTARVDIVGVQLRCWVTDSTKRGGEAWFDNCKLEAGSIPTAYTDDWVKEYYRLGPELPWFAVDFDYEVSPAVVTPHLAPSQCSSEDRIPVLFAMYWSALREAVELAERGNILAWTAAMNTGGKRDKTSKMHERCALRLREQLARNPRVLVLDGGAWQNLISKDRAAIEERVRQGMGMVFYNLSPGGVPERVTELLGRCQTQPIDIEQSCQFGKGCIVALYQRGKFPDTFAHEERYDRAVRAIYLAAQRPVGELVVKATPAPFEAGQPWRVEATLTNAAGATPAHTRVRIYANLGGTNGAPAFALLPVLQEKKIAFPESGIVELQSVGAGDYMVETSILAMDGRAIAWNLQPIVVDGAVRIREVRSAHPVLEPGQACSVDVRLENRSGQPRDVTLGLRLVDTSGRVLAEPGSVLLTLPTGSATTNLLFHAGPSATPMARLEVNLIEKDRSLDQRELEFSAEPLLREPDFRFGFYADYAEGCRQLGADSNVSLDGPAFGCRIFPWFDVLPANEGQIHEPEDSVTNPDTIQRAGKILADGLGKLLPFRTVACVIIDEWEHKFKESSHHLVYFKGFLQKIYPTIAALNTSWGTNLKSFDEVNFAHCSTTAIRDGKISPVAWADLQTAMEHAVADYVAALNTAAHAVDPGVRLGFSGTRETTATNGLDWWLLMQQFGSVSTYGGLHTRLEESFGKPGTRIYQWSYPSRTNTSVVTYHPWRDLFRQRDGYLHYGGRFTPLFFPDLTPYPPALVLEKEIEEIRRGPARLIRGARSEDFGIAVLYSTASYHASHIRKLLGKSGDSINDILYSTDAILADARLGSHFVSYEELAKGKVTTKHFKVLVLPYAQAISAEEAKAVREFARAGGTVIADIRPGIYDEHCKQLPGGQLDDVFGIGPVTGTGLTMSEAMLKTARSGDAAVVVGEPDLQATAATASATVKLKDGTTAPAVLVHAVSKGHAILLNFAFPAYRTYRAGGIGGEVGTEQGSDRATYLCEFISGLITQYAGIKPVARLITSNNDPMRSVPLYTYTDGAAYYVGLLPPRKKSEALEAASGRLTLTKKAHLYDVRAGKYLGHVDSVDRTLEKAHAQLFALLPYSVTGLGLNVPPAAEAGGTIQLTAQIRTQGGPAGRHVIVVRLRRPDGTEQRDDRFTFEAAGGRGEATIPFALNDPAGEWQILVTDAATGASAQARVRVNNRSPKTITRR